MAKPRPCIICGPSGVGKGTLIAHLTENLFPSKFGFSVSHTTRKPRQGEENGVHYHFVGVDVMKGMIGEGKFVEWAEVHGNYYGTSVQAIQSVQNENKICILDIDVQGVQTIKHKSSSSASSLDPIYIFIAPPSMEALESRLRGRNTEDEAAIQRRLANAQAELDYGMKEGAFDAVFVNDDLEKTFGEMAKKFVEWFPVLLGNKQDPPVDCIGQESDDNTSHPFVDPLIFPKTEDGLKALLNDIDQNCPLDGYNQSQLTYQASNLHVKAGCKLDIPLPPVEQDGSKVEWSVTLIDEHSERLDLEFGLAVIVNHEEIMVREMGRILAPHHKNELEEDETIATDGASNDEAETATSAKGKFTVANSAPVTVVIKVDNTYSWFTPKKFNYSFTIIPPVDDNMIQRSIRAKSILPKIMEGQRKASDARDRERIRSGALVRIESEMQVKLDQLNNQMGDVRMAVKEIQQRAEKAEAEAKEQATKIKQTLSMVKKENESIDSCSKQIISLEEECARLKKQWEELKIERQVRIEEKALLETKAETCNLERNRLQEEIILKKEEEKSKCSILESLEKDRSLMDENLRDLQKEKSLRDEEEKMYADQVYFFKRQLEAVKLRCIEQKPI